MKPALLLLLLVLNLLHVNGVFRWKIATRKQRSTQRHKRSQTLFNYRVKLLRLSRGGIADITDKWRAHRNQFNS